MKACDEFVQERILDFAGRGILRHLTMPFGETDPHCIGCTSCAHVCPTGAIQIIDDINHPADPLLIRKHGMKVNAEMATLDKFQCCMREVGTANIVEVMDRYDLLPVHNYKFGQHPDTSKVDSMVLRRKYFKQEHPDGCCFGCSMACAKAVDGFEVKTGPYKGQRVTVDGPEYETVAACTNMGCFDPEWNVMKMVLLINLSQAVWNYNLVLLRPYDIAWYEGLTIQNVLDTLHYDYALMTVFLMVWWWTPMTMHPRWCPTRHR